MFMKSFIVFVEMLHCTTKLSWKWLLPETERNNPKAKWKSLFFSKELFFGQSLVYE